MVSHRIVTIGPVSAMALMAGLPAVAQEYYAGLGFSSAAVDTPLGSSGEVSQTDLIAGVRWSNGNIFYGGELDLSFNDALNTSRIKGLVGTSAGPIDVFVSLGYAGFDGELGGFPTRDSGVSVSLGAEYEINDRFTTRLEVQRDAVDTTFGGYSEPMTHTSIRAAAIFKF